MKKRILQSIALADFFYLIGAFVAAGFNITNWDAMGRFVIAIVVVVSVLFVYSLDFE